MSSLCVSLLLRNFFGSVEKQFKKAKKNRPSGNWFLLIFLWTKFAPKWWKSKMLFCVCLPHFPQWQTSCPGSGPASVTSLDKWRTFAAKVAKTGNLERNSVDMNHFFLSFRVWTSSMGPLNKFLDPRLGPTASADFGPTRKPSSDLGFSEVQKIESPPLMSLTHETHFEKLFLKSGEQHWNQGDLEVFWICHWISGAGFRENTCSPVHKQA